MLTLEPARTDQHYETLLDLIFHQRSNYLEPVQDLTGLTWDQFGHFFRTTGTAFRIFREGELVGLCWVEIRAETIFLLGLIVKPDFEGQGIGSQALIRLETDPLPDIRRIRLQVHAANIRARALYEHMGYHAIDYACSSGFYTMQKTLRYNSPYGRLRPGWMQRANAPFPV